MVIFGNIPPKSFRASAQLPQRSRSVYRYRCPRAFLKSRYPYLALSLTASSCRFLNSESKRCQQARKVGSWALLVQGSGR